VFDNFSSFSTLSDLYRKVHNHVFVSLIHCNYAGTFLLLIEFGCQG